MPIHIVNTGKNKSPTGEHHYELRINSRLICGFTHTREAGLAECLRKAAKAVEDQESADFAALIAAIQSDPKVRCGGGK